MTLTSELRKRFSAEPAFSSRDIRTFFARRRVSRAYCNLMVHKMLAEGKLFRIGRGAYTFHGDAQAVGFAFQPFYYGLQDALSLRGIWEQETVPVVVTPRRVRAGVRAFLGANYVVRRVSRRMFFGYEMVKRGGFWVPVSDAEKTFIDMVYFRQPLAPKLVRAMARQMRPEVLKRHLARAPAWLRPRVYKALPHNYPLP
jgi:predicted transcriptional regulator of viral defense system